jgi:iron complex outermembrane recepter protein
VTTGSANITFVNIRGVGYSANGPALSAGVANYRDGLFISQAPFLIDALYDVQQVEVLRGPQGTLSGQNSTGGAILVSTRNPTLDQISGYLTAQYGNYQDKLVEGALNLPINDRYGVRIAFNYEDRDSFFTNLGGGASAVVSHPGNLLREDVRLSLLAEPIDEVEVLLKLEHSLQNSDGQPMKPIPGSYYAPYAPTDPYTINFNVLSGQNDVTTDRANLQVTYHVLPTLDLKSQTGYQSSVMNIADDEDATPLNGQYSTQSIGDHLFTQEINAVTIGNGPVHGVVGAYFLYDTLPSNLNTVEYTGFLGGPPFNGFVLGGNLVNKETSEAVYAQGTWDMTSQLQLVAGARYTYDRKSDFGALSLGGMPVPYTGYYGKDATTGKVALNWNVTSNDLLYVQASRGFKAGGINSAASNFAPEFVWNYETGYKTTFLDGHMRSQVDAYYMDYNNFQISQTSPTGAPPIVVNSAGAIIKGFEGQLQAKFSGLQVDGTVAYTHSEFKPTEVFDTDAVPFNNLIPSFLLGLPPAFYAANQINLAGHPLDYAPKVTANLGAEYGFHLIGDHGVLTPRAQISYVGGQWGEPYDTPVYDFIPSHTTVDLRLTWEPDDLWRVALYGTNVANRAYIVGKEFRFATEFYGPPAQYGVRVTRSFN